MPLAWRMTVFLGAFVLLAGVALGTRRLELVARESDPSYTADCGTVLQPHCEVTRHFGGQVLFTALLMSAGFASLSMSLARWYTDRNGAGWSTNDLAMIIVPTIVLLDLVGVAVYWIYVSTHFEGV